MSNYILNINKGVASTTPQVVGRVADLPKNPIYIKLKDGDDKVDLNLATVEFRGVTSSGQKLIVKSGVIITNKTNGEFRFTFPKGFYSSPGTFRRAYFVIKRDQHIDTTQDLMVHVIEDVDVNVDDAEHIFEGLDKVVAQLEKQIKEDTQRLIQQIKNDTASTIADSNKKLADLDKQINDFKTNTNLTIAQINGEITKLNNRVNSSNSEINKLQSKLNDLSIDINDKNIIKTDMFNTRLPQNLIVDPNFVHPNIADNWVADGVTYTKAGEFLKIVPRGSGSERIYNRTDLGLKVGELYSISFVAYGESSSELSIGTYASNTKVKITTVPQKYYIDGIVFSGSSNTPNIFTLGNVIFIREITFTKTPKAVDNTPSQNDIVLLQRQIDDLKKAITALGGS